jgi:hypothetical protein
MSESRKPGVAFWATVIVVAAFVLYPLSVGPALWLEGKGLVPDWATDAVDLFYDPFWMAVESLPQSVQDKVEWYTELWQGVSEEDRRADRPPRYIDAWLGVSQKAPYAV